MKAVILAGGHGSRLSEETDVRPKPMVGIGGQPIIWHILKTYGHYGINDFIICLGYKGYVIKEYFANYALHNSNITFDLHKGTLEVHENESEPWRVTLVDTGVDTQTGGRLARIRDFIGDETFCMTYGDGLGDVAMTALIAFHNEHGKAATLTAVAPPGRFGALHLDGDAITAFEEKPTGGSAWINGGFFVLEPSVFDLIDGDGAVWEQAPLENLAARGELRAYRHEGFWQCMDTLRDRRLLEKLWAAGGAPWKVWD